MRLPDYTLNADFIRVDSNTTAVDEYLNVRDLQTYAKNHNWLLANYVRTNLLTQIFLEDSSNNPLSLQGLDPITEDRSSGVVVMNCPLWIPPYTKELEVVVVAERSTPGSGTASDPQLFPIVDTVETIQPLDSAKVITVSATSKTKYTLTIPVPRTIKNNSRAVFTMYLVSPMSNTALAGPTAITSIEIESGSVLGAVNADYTGHAVVFSNTKVFPRLVNYYESNVVGTDDRMHIGERWDSEAPIPGTDTWSVKEVASLELYSVSIYALATTDLTADPGV